MDDSEVLRAESADVRYSKSDNSKAHMSTANGQKFTASGDADGAAV